MIVLLLNSSYKETRELPFAAISALAFFNFFVDLIRKQVDCAQVLSKIGLSRHMLRTSWSCA
jgi:hypothetical protein